MMQKKSNWAIIINAVAPFHVRLADFIPRSQVQVKIAPEATDPKATISHPLTEANRTAIAVSAIIWTIKAPVNQTMGMGR